MEAVGLHILQFGSPAVGRKKGAWVRKQKKAMTREEARVLLGIFLPVWQPPRPEYTLLDITNLVQCSVLGIFLSDGYIHVLVMSIEM